MATEATAQVLVDSIWRHDIRTVTFYRSGIDQERPTLLLGSDDHAQLTFDLLADEPETFRYTLRHCNADWSPDDLERYEYLTGFEDGYIDSYEPSINTLQPYYNYTATIPADGMQLSVSGNYIVCVYSDDNPDSIVLTRRLWVTENLVTVRQELTRPTNGSSIMQSQEVNIYVDNRDDLPFGSYTPYNLSPTYLSVAVQQNGRRDNQRWLPFSGYANGTLCYRWKDENIFAGGNSYRYFDASNLHATMYNIQRVEQYDDQVFAILLPDENRSHKHFENREGLMGGMKVNAHDRSNPPTEAEYVWVNFSLPMQQPIMTGAIYISGELTGWHLDDNSRMEWKPNLKAYTKRLYLKQGYYAYQLLYRGVGEKEAQTSMVEGDHFETPNQYHAYVYYQAPGDRYCRLLGNL